MDNSDHNPKSAELLKQFEEYLNQKNLNNAINFIKNSIGHSMIITKDNMSFKFTHSFNHAWSEIYNNEKDNNAINHIINIHTILDNYNDSQCFSKYFCKKFDDNEFSKLNNEIVLMITFLFFA